jgi:metallo-beta-lactamase family protein
MKIRFLGAAGEVTGSQHLLEKGDLRVLLDCGLFQGRRSETRHKNERFHCDPKNLDAVILSHAHIDHSGNLPGLYKAGFRGDVYCTAATADIAQVMLQDAAHIQKEDARYMSKHLDKGSVPFEPLYDMEDVRGICNRFQTLNFNEWHELAPDFRLRFLEAGHILGSAIVEMDIQEKGDWKRVVFTGDLGRRNLPLLRDPKTIERCDVLISESTYGDSVHLEPDNIKLELIRVIKEAQITDGRIIVPAFALGRTQQLVYFLNELSNAGKIPAIPIFVDSPLAIKLTDIYRDHLGIMDSDIQDSLRTDHDPFGFKKLQYLLTPQESMTINNRKGTFMVIAASGMCESGRIVHHLKHGMDNPDNTIVLIGYQAEHTLGRRIQERQPYQKIMGHEYALKAHVENFSGLSAHADANDFHWWYEAAAQEGGIGKVFLVHGEHEAATALSKHIRDFCDEDPIIPQWGDSFEV